VGILLPPKIYLDTNHLIEITKVRKSVSPTAYSFIDEHLRAGHFGIIFSPAAALDWVDGKATIESAKEIAEVVDSAQLQYEIDADSIVFLHQIVAELRRIEPGIRLPDFDVFLVRDFSKTAPRAIPVLKNTVPGFFEPGELLEPDAERPNEIPFFTAREHVERAYICKTERPEVYRERVDGYRAATSHDVNCLAQRGRNDFTSAEELDWMKRFVRIDRVIAAYNPGIPIDELLSQVDLKRCPAVNQFLNAQLARARNENQTVCDNDVDDWMIVHIVSFSDVFLTEKNLAHYIRQADPILAKKVTRYPEAAVEMLRPWIGESG
jgi:predicted nucleic acid-binding protein